MKCEHCTNEHTHTVTIMGIIIQYLCAFHYWHYCNTTSFKRSEDKSDVELAQGV